MRWFSSLPDGTTLFGVILKVTGQDVEWQLPDGTTRVSPAYIVGVMQEEVMPDGTTMVHLMRGVAPEFALEPKRSK